MFKIDDSDDLDFLESDFLQDDFVLEPIAFSTQSSDNKLAKPAKRSSFELGDVHLSDIGKKPCLLQPRKEHGSSDIFRNGLSRTTLENPLTHQQSLTKTKANDEPDWGLDCSDSDFDLALVNQQNNADVNDNITQSKNGSLHQQRCLPRNTVIGAKTNNQHKLGVDSPDQSNIKLVCNNSQNKSGLNSKLQATIGKITKPNIQVTGIGSQVSKPTEDLQSRLSLEKHLSARKAVTATVSSSPQPSTSTRIDYSPCVSSASLLSHKMTNFESPSSKMQIGKTKRKFPGPAGVLPKLNSREEFESLPLKTPDLPMDVVETKVLPCSQGTQSSQFEESAFQVLQENIDREILKICKKFTIAQINEKASQKILPKGKVPVTTAVLDAISIYGADASVNLKDSSGEIKATIHRQIVKEHQAFLQPGTAVLLKKVGVFSPSPRKHYLNITSSNVVHFYYRKDGEIISKSVNEISLTEVQESLKDFPDHSVTPSVGSSGISSPMLRPQQTPRPGMSTPMRNQSPMPRNIPGSQQNRYPPVSNVRGPNQNTPRQSMSNIRAPHQSTPRQPVSNIRAPHQNTPRQPVSNIRKPHQSTPRQPVSNIRAPHQSSTPRQPVSNIQTPVRETSLANLGGPGSRQTLSTVSRPNPQQSHISNSSSSEKTVQPTSVNNSQKGKFNFKKVQVIAPPGENKQESKTTNTGQQDWKNDTSIDDLLSGLDEEMMMDF